MNVAMDPAGRSAPHAGRIGPNAIIRLADSLRALKGEVSARNLFDNSGIGDLLEAPPTEMVDEDQVTHLYARLYRELEAGAAQVARDAGRRTGDYLLANRIPRAAQFILRRLPAPLAARALIAAIGKHSWTFAGSGAFSAQAGNPCVFTIRACPMCRGQTATQARCDFYAGTFERLFRALVHRDARVVETTCEAAGADACRFEAGW